MQGRGCFCLKTLRWVGEPRGVMKMTDSQREMVKDSIADFAANELCLGWGEAKQISSRLLEEVCADIEETADWDGLEDDEIHDGDVSIAIGRVIAKRL